jgi:predicted O-methyltransferase YrrM
MTPEQVLAKIEQRGKAHGWPIIGPERGKFLDEAVKRHRPKRVLEVGALVGYSAIRIARLLGPGGRIICVEIDPNRAEVAVHNAERAGLDKVIEVTVGDAKKIIPTLAGEFDLVFLDADKTEYLRYLKLVEPRLRRGGVVVADNVKRHEVELKDYLRYVRESGAYLTEKTRFAPTFSTGEPDAIEVSVKL